MNVAALSTGRAHQDRSRRGALLHRRPGQQADPRNAREGWFAAVQCWRYAASMWWHKKDRVEKPLREQLTDARDDLRRQIEVLEAGPSSTGTAVGDFTDNASLIADLRNTLREIEEELTSLGPANA